MARRSAKARKLPVPFITGALATLDADVEGGGIERSQKQRRLPVVVMEVQKDGGALVNLRILGKDPVWKAPTVAAGHTNV